MVNLLDLDEYGYWEKEEYNMTKERMYAIFNTDTSYLYTGCTVFRGLLIIAKYIDPTKEKLITGSQRGCLFSIDAELLLDSGITEDDCVKLEKFGWLIEGDYLYTSV